MRIESVRLENLRSFEDATVPFNNYRRRGKRAIAA